MLFVYGLSAWLVFMVTAILNGTFRVAILLPSMSEHRAHLVSTAVLCVALIVEIGIFLDIAGNYSSGSLLALGLMWTLLTVAFEFGFGRYVARESWVTLLENYDVLRGRVWIAVLLVLLLTPLILG
jgi:hypothetical protein